MQWNAVIWSKRKASVGELWRGSGVVTAWSVLWCWMWTQWVASSPRWRRHGVSRKDLLIRRLADSLTYELSISSVYVMCLFCVMSSTYSILFTQGHRRVWVSGIVLGWSGVSFAVRWGLSDWISRVLGPWTPCGLNHHSLNHHINHRNPLLWYPVIAHPRVDNDKVVFEVKLSIMGCAH